jgi:hypothetical protein
MEVAFGTTLQVSRDLAGASTESVAQTAAAALAGASAGAAGVANTDGGHFSAAAALAGASAGAAGVANTDGGHFAGDSEGDSQTNTPTPNKRNAFDALEVVSPSSPQSERSDKLMRVCYLADVPINRTLQKGIPDDPPRENEVLQVTDNFTLLFNRRLRLLFWPCAGNLLLPHFGIDATGAIKFKGAIKSNQVAFFRWPVIGGTVGAQGFQAALDEVKDALRRQLAKWQSEGTGAVRCRSKASS